MRVPDLQRPGQGGDFTNAGNRGQKRHPFDQVGVGEIAVESGQLFRDGVGFEQLPDLFQVEFMDEGSAIGLDRSFH